MCSGENAGDEGAQKVLPEHDKEYIQEVLAAWALEGFTRLRHFRAEKEARKDDGGTVTR